MGEQGTKVATGGRRFNEVGNQYEQCLLLYLYLVLQT